MAECVVKSGSPERLAELLAGGASWSATEALWLVQRLAVQVQALHEDGRLHLAIGSEAVTIDDAGRPHLSAASGPRRFGGEESDPEFCPPLFAETESLELPLTIAAAMAVLRQHGRTTDPRRIDVYQLGVLLCRLLTGEPLLAYMFRPAVKARIPAVARTVLARALAIDDANPYADCQQLLAALGDAVRDADAAQTPNREAETPAGGSVIEPSDTPPQGRPVAFPPDAKPSGPESLPFEQLGHYRIVARIGRGGMGDVYQGYDQPLDRYVAIKVLPAELARDAEFVRRFQAEATAAAKVAHPNVVPVYFIGQDAGHHFFAMQFITGESLARRLAGQRRLPLDEVLTIAQDCLAGLQAAHAHHLVHRDVKPGNVLLDEQTGRAVLVDFGLVRAAGQGNQLTATGVVMGTVDYIAPEQARGLKVDGRADIYSLGVLLYQSLAGRLPFVADSPTTMMFQHAYEEPFPLLEAAPDLPPTIAAIIARMMAKQPDERYATCADVLADIRAFRQGQSPAPIQPEGGVATDDWPLVEKESIAAEDLELGRTGVGQRARDWAATIFRRHAPQALQDLQTTTQQVDGAVAQYERRRRGLAKLLSEARDIRDDLAAQFEVNQHAAVAAASETESAAGEDQRQAAQAKQQACDEALVALTKQHAEQQRQVEELEEQLAKADGKLVGLRSQRDALQARLKAAELESRWDEPKPRLARLPRGLGIATIVGVVGVAVLAWPLFRLIQPSALTTDSRPTAESPHPVTGDPGSVTTTTGQSGETVVAMPSQPLRYGFLPDGSGFLVGEEDATIWLHRLLNRKVVQSTRLTGLPPPEYYPEERSDIVISPSGKWIAASGSDELVRIWELGRSKELAESRRLVAGRPAAMSFSSDGNRLLTAGFGGVGLWDVLTETEIKRPALHAQGVTPSSAKSIAWSRDGSRVLMGCAFGKTSSFNPDDQMVLWNISTERLEVAYEDSKGRTPVVAFSRSEDQAYGFRAGAIQVHDTASGRVIQKIGKDLQVVAFSTSTNQALSAGDAPIITLWDLQRATEMKTFAGHTDKIEWLGFSADGAAAMSASRDGTIRIWKLPPAPPPENQLALLNCSGSNPVVAFSPDGNRVLTDSQFGFWLTEFERNELMALRTAAPIASAVFSSDGHYILYGTGQDLGKDGYAGLRDLFGDTERDLRQFKGHQGQITGLGLSQDCRRVVTGSIDGTVRVWDAQTGLEIEKLDVGTPVNSVALSRSGNEILVGANDKTVRLWKWNTTKNVERWDGHSFVVLNVTFSADGKRAASASGDGTLCVWELETGKRLVRLEGHTGGVNAVALSEHGLTALSGGDDGMVRVWDVAGGKEIQRFDGHTGRVRSVAIAPDGTRAVSGSDDGTARVWKLPVLVQ